jgi:uncharacterized protein YfaS (alpha-2-macroglobulin family)
MLKIKYTIAIIGLFFSLSLNAQVMQDYKKEWTNVETAEKKGLTKTASAEANKIFAAATKENNTPQTIKAAIAIMRFRAMVEEEHQENNVFYIDTLIATAKAPATNILYSMQAELLHSYFNNNRWRFYNRTEQVTENAMDIATWSLGKLQKTIIDKYQQSLTNATLLKQTNVKAYDAIVIKGKNTENLRPTLYDFLAHRALTYFTNDERSITQPAYKFTIDNANAFADANTFKDVKFITKDSASLSLAALKIYQDLIALHITNKNIEALVDVDIARLAFVNRLSTLSNKDKWYLTQLQEIEKKYSANAASAQASFLIAQHLMQQAGNDANPKPGLEKNYVLAKEICDKVIKQYPKSEGGINCANLLNDITFKNFAFTTELVNLPNQAFRMLVKYRNIDKLYYRIIKTDRQKLKDLNNRNWNTVWNAYLALSPTKTFTINLPKTSDYREHSVEAKIDALENGTYIFMASSNPDFTTKNNNLAKDVIYVSNIALLNKENAYHVVHRNTGQPLANATVQTYYRKYDYDTRKDQEVKDEKYTTNTNGYFKLKANAKESKNLVFDIKTATEQLFLETEHYLYAAYDEDGNPKVNNDRAFLFIDRSIYRPGQSVYFKGIVVAMKDKPFTTEVVANKKVTISLYDANYQKVKSLTFTTNAFGSYNGVFTLPATGLTGQFYIMDSMHNTTQYFSVEEYKRPKFSVAIEQPKGSYKINDSIKVTGTAKAYAGNNIDGATVKYRIVRKVQYPIWWDYGFYRYGKMSSYSREEMEITNGSTTTNEKGAFTVTFKAIPDESIKKEDQPTFYYELIADITDINGETRTGNISVPVSYQALRLNIDLENKISITKLDSLKINSTNINGIFEAAKLQLSFTKLDAPNRFFRTRKWEEPDQFLLTKDAYEKAFPFDLYKNENEPKNWKKLTTLYTETFTTDDKKRSIPKKNIAPGFYLVEVSGKDKFGEPIHAIKYIEITDDKNQSSIFSAIAVNSDKATYQPNDKINYSFATSFTNIFGIHDQSGMYGKEKLLYEKLNNNSKNFELPVTENDRGGMAAALSFVKYNQVFGDAMQFAIPWTNKELKISFESFRDKTLPGSAEEYKVKISGLKGDKVAAELLATMYDASLDQIKPHTLNFYSPFPTMYNNSVWDGNGNFTSTSADGENFYNPQRPYYDKSYAYLGIRDVKENMEFEWSFGYGENRRFKNAVKTMSKSAPMTDAAPAAAAAPIEENFKSEAFLKKDNKVKASVGYIMADVDNIPSKENESANSNSAPVQIRKNFNETAFFLPDLKTDAEGNIIIKYTIPEALTEWKLLAFAHTKDMATAQATNKVITQKPLMVQPNLPRFLREGDKLDLAVKVVNLSDKEITGTSQLALMNPETNQSVDGWFKNIQPNQYFTIAAGQSSVVVFSIEIPFNYNKPLAIKLIATAADASDGEENIIPVVTNRMLVTESMPLPMKTAGTKNFSFEKLLKSSDATTLSHQAITVEYTSNPAWYAVQALPYLMEYPYECAEQTFNRFYANALASKISNSNPKIKAVFEKWKTIDVNALKSNLEKNEELKSALLQETPWVLEAQNESLQKRNIALLFDMVKMNTELEKSLKKLQEMQSGNGGFVWFKGGYDDRYITQYILTGIGHLKKLDAISEKNSNTINQIINSAVPYLDNRIKEDYDNLIRYKNNLKDNNTGNFQIQYLYMRSFFKDIPVGTNATKAVSYYKEQIKKYWLQNSKYMQGMIALVLHREADKTTPVDILKSLKENAIIKEEMGMYWKEITAGYYWHQAPIESMSLLIETFQEVSGNVNDVNALKTWLLKNKQTNNWKTTKATAEACYALLLQGTNWLANAPTVEVKLDNQPVSFTNKEEGTGYVKTRIEGDKVKPAMGAIQVTVTPTGTDKNISASWGAVYWQYFENLDKITSSTLATETPLKLQKNIFKEINSATGKKLILVNEKDKLNVGDKMIIRIELKVDRDMEYVHMKDMRSSGTEPINVISQYKWQDGLGYYESTKDVSTNFFFGYLPKGTFVFEYPLFVTHKGNFSNGITTIQCMYAPEFTSHSEGVRVKVE